ncbi:MAG: DUF2851 family protein [FCB group bacterium]
MSTYPETILQKAVHKMLSDPSVVRATQNGERLQILSPGKINVQGGPDFLETAILLKGMVIIGEAEFHRKSSEWFAHGHDDDENYDSVILHIIYADDIKTKSAQELPQKRNVLIVDENEVNKIIENEELEQHPFDIFSLEEVQHFALIRLLRKTSEAQKIINTFGSENALTELTKIFLDKSLQKTKRPAYNKSKFELLINALPGSHIREFLNNLKAGNKIKIHQQMANLISKKILNEGTHLRRELILNSILPLAICLANEESRIDLFHWYWSTPALHQYGLLTRRFKNLPQNYLWQQQGLLEYLYEYGKKTNVIAELIKDYGFAEILSFYKHGAN